MMLISYWLLADCCNDWNLPIKCWTACGAGRSHWNGYHTFGIAGSLQFHLCKIRLRPVASRQQLFKKWNNK
jgi:hypothetical protein